MTKKIFSVRPVETMVFDCEYMVLAEDAQEAADLWIEGILAEDLAADLGEVCDPKALERGLELREPLSVSLEGPARVIQWDELPRMIVSITEAKAWKEALANGFDPETREWEEPEDAPCAP